MADDVEALRQERDSQARRCANRFEETQAALDVIRWLRAGRKPDLDTGVWWRNDLRVSWPMTDAHRAALRAAADDDAGVAAGPQATPPEVADRCHACGGTRSTGIGALVRREDCPWVAERVSRADGRG